MAEKCFSVTFVKESDDISNQLHVFISSFTSSTIVHHYQKLKHENSYIGALIRKPNSYPIINYDQALFVTVVVTGNHSSDYATVHESQNRNVLCLLVSETFMNHYSLNNSEDVLFKPVFTLPLERVIFGVKNNSTYEWATSDEWHEYVAKCALEKSLCRNKDALLFKVPEKCRDCTFDFITLDCAPVNQGYITASTTVVVTKLNDDDQKMLNDSKELNTESYLKLIKYASSILLPFGSQPSLSPVTPLFKTSSQSPKVAPSEFNIVVTKKLPHSVFDVHGAVFLCEKILRNLDLSCGDWVEVCVFYQEKEITDMSNPRFTRVFALPLDASVDECTVYVSPQFWLNVQNTVSSLMETSIKLKLLGKVTKIPQYAKEVYLALIPSPHYSSSVAVGNLIEKYFSLARLVKKGDILALSSVDSVGYHQQLDNTDDFRWPIFYAKVTNIPTQEDRNGEQCGYLISNEHSLIYQVGTAQSYVPTTMESFLSCTSTNDYLSGPALPGMQSYLEKLHDLVFPLLKFWSDSKTVNANVLLTGPVGCGKSMLVRALCRCLNLHLYEVNCHNLFIEPTVEGIKDTLNRAQLFAPCVMLLKDGDYIGKERETLEKDPKLIRTFCQTMKKLNCNLTFPVITIATSSQARAINPEVNSVFLHHFQIESPTERERLQILENLFDTSVLSNDVSLLYIAQRTAGLVFSDLNILANLAAKSAYLRMKDNVCSLTKEEQDDVCRAGVPICHQDVVQALDEVNLAQAQAIGAPKIPNVRWEDVGGLADIKEEIVDTIQLPLQHPELLLSGLRRSGVLLYGPPGTGKTMLAKAVATECSLNFISVKGPELINMYVGQSEENVREVFSRARSAAPCIVFFDEIDSLAPNRGKSGDSGGVMDRLVSQLLAELDGLNKSAEVFVIGATNRPDLLDPALLRPGRFDRLLYVGIAPDRDSRMKILLALTRKFKMDDEVDLGEVEAKCSPNLTGADFYALCSGAYMNAVRRLVGQMEKGERFQKEVRVSRSDFFVSVGSLTPSVSEEDLIRFESIRASFNA